MAESGRETTGLSSSRDCAHILPMAKSPRQPRNPASHSKKDPAHPTRSKAHRPDSPPTDPALERLLNPGIEKGTAGMGSGTGLKPPPDNSFDRRADFSAAHRARKSAQQGFAETPQRGYAAKGELNARRNGPRSRPQLRD